jgi:hypothetical protein
VWAATAAFGWEVSVEKRFLDSDERETIGHKFTTAWKNAGFLKWQSLELDQI